MTEPSQGYLFNFLCLFCIIVIKTVILVVIIASIGLERLPFKPEGYNFWTWQGRKIHYVVEGEGLPIVLVHGFGASAFHWRYFPVVLLLSENE